MSLRSPRVLIVEDDPDTLLVLRVGLDAAGFETSLAADGGTAMRRIGSEHPDLVLLDLMLPVMDGWAVLAEVGRTPGAPPVVVLSARGTRLDMTRAFQMGAERYVIKPFDLIDLCEALRDVMERCRSPQRESERETTRSAEGLELA